MKLLIKRASKRVKVTLLTDALFVLGMQFLLVARESGFVEVQHLPIFYCAIEHFYDFSLLHKSHLN